MGHTDILKILLNNGAELGNPDTMGRTPLHLAAWGGNPDCVKLVLDHAPELVNFKVEDVTIPKKFKGEWVDSWDHDHQSLTDMVSTTAAR